MENPINQQIGQRVADVRTQMKLTQAELAAEMSARLGRDIRPLTITRLEGGKRPITVDELMAAAAALKVTITDLVGPGDLPAGAIRVQSAGREAVRALNALQHAVREWVSARNHLASALGMKASASLPPASRLWAEKLSELDVHDIVDEAVTGAEADDD